MVEILELNFDKDGNLIGAFPDIPQEITDVIFVAHGWNETADTAKAQYQALFDALEQMLAQAPGGSDKRVAYFGVIWPSMKYASDLTVVDMSLDASAPPATAGVPVPPLAKDELLDRTRDLAPFLGVDEDELIDLVSQAADAEEGCDALVARLQAATADRRSSSADEQTEHEYREVVEDAGRQLFRGIEHGFRHLQSTVAKIEENPLSDWLSRLRSDSNAIVAQILNLFAYNEMKIRAGAIGVGLATHAVNPLLKMNKRVHLVGHSFGARLMTAATQAASGKIDSLILLEGAFSHNGLTYDAVGSTDGAFKSVIDDHKVTGAIVAGHSDQDAPVWIAYPLASRVYHDTVSLSPAGIVKHFFGGPSDRYGAMGANGPQNLPSAVKAPFGGDRLPEVARGVYVLDCTSFVHGHSDVWKRGATYIIAGAMLL